MSYRGWKYRCYADEPETPVADFICAALGGSTALFNFPAWLLIYFGWLSVTTTLLICAGVGLLFGCYLTYFNGSVSARKMER